MDRRIKVGAGSDFVEGRGRPVVVDGRRVAVFRHEGRLYAVQDACPHMGTSLAERGLVHRGRVICGWHHWPFDLETGRGDVAQCLQTYAVDETADAVFVTCPPPATED